MITDKVKKILGKYISGPIETDEAVGEILDLYYKYENEQIKLSIQEQKDWLKKQLEEHLEEYGREMLNAFYKYWTEHNKNGKKCLFKMNKVFNVKGRLATWARHDKEYAQRKRLKEWVNK